MLTESDFYSQITPANMCERLLRVPEPLRFRIMGDLYYEGMLGSVHPQHARSYYLEYYQKAADLGDMVAMAEYEVHCADEESKYADQIDDSDPLAWAIHLHYTNRLEESLQYFLPLVDTSLRALYYCWSVGGLVANDQEACRKLFESRYLPAIPEIADQFIPVSEDAVAVGSLFGHTVLRRRFLLTQQDVMRPRQLANLATSKPVQTQFIMERVHKTIANVERYIYGQLRFTGWETKERYLNIRRDVLDWINCFTCCLLVTRVVPRDIRQLLTKWVWSVRFDYVEEVL